MFSLRRAGTILSTFVTLLGAYRDKESLFKKLDQVVTQEKNPLVWKFEP
jgi:hypothetical protein